MTQQCRVPKLPSLWACRGYYGLVGYLFLNFVSGQWFSDVWDHRPWGLVGAEIWLGLGDCCSVCCRRIGFGRSCGWPEFYSCPSKMTDSRSWVQFVHSYVFFPPGKIWNHGQATILLTGDPEEVVWEGPCRVRNTIQWLPWNAIFCFRFMFRRLHAVVLLCCA